MRTVFGNNNPQTDKNCFIIPINLIHKNIFANMEIIEESLTRLGQQAKSAIDLHTQNVFTTIHRVAGTSISAAKNVDSMFTKAFPELLEQIAGHDAKPPFNPEIAIECINNTPTAIKYAGTWHKDIGLLPNRRVICEYWVDVGEPTIIVLIRKKGSYWCGTTNHTLSYTGSTCSKCRATINGFDNSHIIDSYCLNGPPTTSSITRNEHRPLFDATSSHKFEVDNYLNLYQPETGLYIMFNKTAFPAFTFLARPTVFQSKRLSAITFKFDKTWYNSKDATETILKAVLELIPENYSTVIDFYNRFLSMDGFKATFAEDAQITETLDDSPAEKPTDSRDTLIAQLQIQLRQANKRLELIDSMHEEMVGMYKKQTADLAELTTTHEQFKAEYEIKTKTELIVLNEQLFTAKKTLADASSYQAKCMVLGADIDQLQETVRAKEQEVKKYKSQAVELTNEVLVVKKEKKDSLEKMNTEMRRATNHLDRITRLEDMLTNTKRDLSVADAKIKTLEHQLIDVSKKSFTNTLEDVLTARTEELTNDKADLTAKLSIVKAELVESQRAYTALKGCLADLVGSGGSSKPDELPCGKPELPICYSSGRKK